MILQVEGILISPAELQYGETLEEYTFATLVVNIGLQHIMSLIVLGLRQRKMELYCPKCKVRNDRCDVSVVSG